MRVSVTTRVNDGDTTAGGGGTAGAGASGAAHAPIRLRSPGGEVVLPGVPRTPGVDYDAARPKGRKHAMVVTTTGGEDNKRTCDIREGMFEGKGHGRRLRTLHTIMKVCIEDWRTRLRQHNKRGWAMPEREWESDESAYLRTKKVLDKYLAVRQRAEERLGPAAFAGGVGEALHRRYTQLKTHNDTWGYILGYLTEQEAVPFHLPPLSPEKGGEP